MGNHTPLKLRVKGWKLEDVFYTHWLKETKGYFLSREELVKLLEDAFDAGVRKERTKTQYFHYNDEFEEKRLKTYEKTPDKEAYINSLLK